MTEKSLCLCRPLFVVIHHLILIMVAAALKGHYVIFHIFVTTHAPDNGAKFIQKFRNCIVT